MDEDSKELVQAVTEAGFSAFFKTIAAPIVEVGGWGADIIRRHRYRSTLRTLELANKWLSEAGLDAHPIPLKVLVPLLELASLEDDVDEADNPEDAHAMHERWAALLANAAAGDVEPHVAPSFPKLLAEIEPVEARMLQRLTETRKGFPVDYFRAEMGFADDDAERFDVQLNNLARLRLCEINEPSAYLDTLVARLEDHLDDELPPPARKTTVRLTSLGRAFITACTPPMASGADAHSSLHSSPG